MTEEERKTITQAVQTAKKRIAEAAIASGRKPEDITLVAATKMNDAERVRAAIAAGVTGELFRRSETNRSNQSGSLGGLLFISIAGAFLAAWIFRAAAAGETVSQFILTLAAAVILFFGTGIVLRYNERRNRV